MRLNAIVGLLLISWAVPAIAQQDGAALYAAQCAQCHDSSDAQSRIPPRSAMQAMSFEHVLAALTTGSMAAMAQGRRDDERKAIASFVTGKAAASGAVAAADASGRCM